MMEILEIKEKEIWQDFVFSFEMAQFLHSWQWGEFQKNLGRKIFRLAVLKDKKIFGVALLIKMLLPTGKSYFYCPRGPIFKENNQEAIKIFFEKIKEIAKKEKAIFLRFEPLSKDFLSIIYSLGFKVVRQRLVQPSKTIIVDLTKSEEEILLAMHPKTRYNIRLAEKRGVRVKIGQIDKELEVFLELLHQTTKRDKFTAHPDDYYRKLFQLDKNFTKLFLAEYQGKIIAGNLMIFFADTATYAHGASADENKNVMAPHLLHWTAIKEAKRMCLKYYDFWGIDEKKWPGVTRFKKSFVNDKTGLEISYPGTFDLVLDKFWYKIYQLGKYLKNF